jgi:hypothetical protein
MYFVDLSAVPKSLMGINVKISNRKKSDEGPAIKIKIESFTFQHPGLNPINKNSQF